jgi:hypothetical protein
MLNSTRFRSWINDLRYTVSEYAYSVVIAGVLVIAAVGLSGWYGYQWYLKWRVYPAYEALAQCAQEFEHASSQNGTQEDWQLLQSLCQSGYKKYASHRAAPYFLLLESEALIKQGNTHEGFALLEKALQQLTVQSPVYYFYKTKQALMEFDNPREGELLAGSDGDTATQENIEKVYNPERRALDQLRILAEDMYNPYRDYALFYRGYYYWAHDDIAQARTAWEPLLAMIPATSEKPEQKTSPWALLAREKLNQISYADNETTF